MPTNVAQWDLEWNVDGYSLTNQWWTLDVSANLIDHRSQSEALAAFFVTAMPSLLELVHDHARISTCRLRAWGITTVENAPPNTGTWSGGTPHNTALGLQWVYAGIGRRSWALSYIPGVPDIFTRDGVSLSDVGIGNGQASGTDFMAAMNAIRTGSGSPIVLGTLQRSLRGAPLSHSVFVPYDGVNVTQKLVTIRRRIPRGQPT